jgi:hypothetical protein
VKRFAATLALLALVLSGCGGGSDTTAHEAATPPRSDASQHRSRAYVAAADRICAGMVAASRRFAVRLGRSSDRGLSALALTTRALIEPALPPLERSARRLRAVAARSDDLAFQSYVSLYDPIIAVVRDRAAAGEAGDATRAHALELQMLDLSNLQRKLAQEAGLKTCDVDFIHTFANASRAR